MEDKEKLRQRLEMVQDWIFQFMQSKEKHVLEDSGSWTWFCGLVPFLAERQVLGRSEYKFLADVWHQKLTRDNAELGISEKAAYMVAVSIFAGDTFSDWRYQVSNAFKMELTDTSNKKNWALILGYIKGMFETIRFFITKPSKEGQLDPGLENLFVDCVMEILYYISKIKSDSLEVRDALEAGKNKHFACWLSSCVKDIFAINHMRIKNNFASKLMAKLTGQFSLREMFLEENLNQIKRLILTEIAYAGFGRLSLREQIEAIKPKEEK